MQDDLSGTRLHCEQLQDRSVELTSELGLSRQKLEEAWAASKEVALKEELAAARSKGADAENVVELYEELASARGRCELLQDDSAELNSELTAAKQRMEEAAAAFEAHHLKDELNYAENESLSADGASQLHQDLAAERARCGVLQDDSEQLRIELARLHEHLEAARADNRERILREELYEAHKGNDAVKALVAAQQKLVAAQSEISDLQHEEAVAIGGQKAALKEELAYAFEGIEREEKLLELHDEVLAARKEAALVRHQENEVLREEMAEERQRGDHAQGVVKLHEELSAARGMCLRLQDRSNDLTSEVELLRHELEEANPHGTANAAGHSSASASNQQPGLWSSFASASRSVFCWDDRRGANRGVAGAAQYQPGAAPVQLAIPARGVKKVTSANAQDTDQPGAASVQLDMPT